MRTIHILCVPALLLPLAACASFLGGGKPDNLFRFGVSEPQAVSGSSAPTARTQVTLARIGFSPEIDGDRILTTRGDSILYIKDARWVAPAPDLFAQAVTRQFGQRAPAVRLTPPGEHRGSGILLRLDVDRFEARYDQASAKDAPPVIQLSGTAELVDLQSRQIIASRRFALEEPAAANGKVAIVSAFDAVVSRCIADIVDWTAGRPEIQAQ
ncbi:ABC-type transport auxiliary lipoprotein family protein [Sphingomonas sp. YL-JM2C]